MNCEYSHRILFQTGALKQLLKLANSRPNRVVEEIYLDHRLTPHLYTLRSYNTLSEYFACFLRLLNW